MYWVKLTQTERKRLNDAYVAQAAQLQLSGREELPRDVGPAGAFEQKLTVSTAEQRMKP